MRATLRDAIKLHGDVRENVLPFLFVGAGTLGIVQEILGSHLDQKIDAHFEWHQQSEKTVNSEEWNVRFDEVKNFLENVTR